MVLKGGIEAQVLHFWVQPRSGEVFSFWFDVSWGSNTYIDHSFCMVQVESRRQFFSAARCRRNVLSSRYLKVGITFIMVRDLIGSLNMTKNEHREERLEIHCAVSYQRIRFRPPASRHWLCFSKIIIMLFQLL